MTNRLFVSLEIPDEIKEGILEIRDEIYTDKKVRWEKRDKIHLTLKFLGDTELKLNNKIIEIIEDEISDFKPFKMEVNGFGIFNRKGKPAILWAGLSENEELKKLAGRLDKRFVKLGFTEEKRKFKSHLTLLRLKGREDEKKIKEFLNIRLEDFIFSADKIRLYKSELLKSGSIYTVLKEFELK